MAEGQRLARFDRQLPQGQLAGFAQGGAEVVGLPHRDTAGGQDQVDIAQLGQAAAGACQVIRQDARIDHVAAQPLQPADQQPAITVVDLPRPQRQAGFDQFVTGGQHRHPHLAHHVQPAVAQGRGQAQLDRPKPGAGAHHLFALAGFLALGTNVLPDLQRFKKAYPAILRHLGVFLHLDAVGAFGQRRPGEDTRTGARLQRLRRMTGENPLADRQGFALPVGQTQGVTVHGAVRPRWQVERGHQVAGQHTALSFGQRQVLGVADRCRFGQCQ